MKVLFVRSFNNGPDPITDRQAESLVSAGIQVGFYNILGKGSLGYLKNLPNLIRSVNRQKPDILHAHYLWSSLLASLILWKPLVVSFMGSDIMEASTTKLILIKSFIRIRSIKVLVKNIAMKERLRYAKISVLPNGVNLKQFYPLDKYNSRKEINWPKKAKIIGWFANPKRKEKNYALFEVIQNKIVSNEFISKVEYNIPSEKMNLFINAVDVIVLTSKFEGSPNIIKEAMACNKPIVSSKVGDVGELFENANGCFIACDVEDFCNKILMAYTMRTSNGRNSLIEKGYDDITIAKKLIEIYLKVI